MHHNNNAQILNTIQKLWDYLLLCPICQDHVREIDLHVAPDQIFGLISWSKSDNTLYIDTQAKTYNERYSIKYSINVIDNDFDVLIKKIGEEETSVSRATSPYFYFWMNSRCKKCGLSGCSTNDLELNLLTKKIIHIGVENEDVYLMSGNSGYHIENVDKNQTHISQCAYTSSNGIRQDKKSRTFPFITFDFSNPDKVRDKIKTLLVFS